MTREDVLQSVSLKKRFCKDQNIPIAVYDNPYFYERLLTINQVIPCVDAFELFCNEMSQFENEQTYFEYYNRVKDSVIDYLKSNPVYNEFNEWIYPVNTSYPKQNLYVEQNNGKRFISLDMKQANFSALKKYSPDIFGGCSTWRSFLSMFTQNEHLLTSKYIRQVIMGACNPSKQIKYEKHLMSNLLNGLVEQFPNYDIFSLGEDEIIISLKDDDNVSLIGHHGILAKYISSTNLSDIIRITPFSLEKIGNTGGWIKHAKKEIYTAHEIIMIDGIEFKCLSAEIYHQWTVGKVFDTD